MSFISFSQEHNDNTTVVDNNFIKNYMPKLSGDFLKIYLYMLMLSSNNEDVSLDEVASKFGIFSSEVVKALTSMSEDGICEFSKNGDNFSLSFATRKTYNKDSNTQNTLDSNTMISFNNSLNHVETNQEDINTKPLNSSISSNFNTQINAPLGMSFDGQIINNTQNCNIDIQSQINKQNKDMVLNFTNNVNTSNSLPYDYTNMEAKKVVKPKEVTKYSPEELGFLLDVNTDISDLKNFIEQTYATTFTGSTLQTLVGICEQDYVPVSTLKLIVSYLYNNNHKIIKLAPLLTALENKAIEISERNLKDEAEIDNYLSSTSRDYMEIFRHFGIIGRAVTPAEKSIIDKWIYTYNMSMPLILEACDKTIRKTNRASFEYADAIIKGWKENNILSLDDLSKHENKAPKIYKVPAVNYQKQSSKFNNYTNNPSNNLSDFEMQNMAKLYDKYSINK